MASNDKKGSPPDNLHSTLMQSLPNTTGQPPKLKSGLLWALIRLGELHDVPRDELLQSAGLENPAFEEPDRNWDYASGLKLWRLLLDRCPHAHLGLESAPLILLSEADLPRLVLAHASHLGEAINLLIELQGLVDSTQPLRFEIDSIKAQARLRFELAAELLPFDQAIESLVATTFLLFRNLVGEAFPLKHILFMHDLAREMEPYRDFFGVEPRFGQKTCEFVFAQQLLARPIVTARPNIGRHLAAYARILLEQEENKIEKHPKPATWCDRVLETLQTLEPSHWNLEIIAKRLAMSGRTLQRRLEEENNSFDQTLEEFRRGKATTLLNIPNLSLDEIASSLGYADRRGFQRAYKRWTGTTPGQHRKSTP